MFSPSLRGFSVYFIISSWSIHYCDIMNDGEPESKDLVISQLNDLVRMKSNIIAGLRKEIDELKHLSEHNDELHRLRGEIVVCFT